MQYLRLENKHLTILYQIILLVCTPQENVPNTYLIVYPISIHINQKQVYARINCVSSSNYSVPPVVKHIALELQGARAWV